MLHKIKIYFHILGGEISTFPIWGIQRIRHLQFTGSQKFLFPAKVEEKEVAAGEGGEKKQSKSKPKMFPNAGLTCMHFLWHLPTEWESSISPNYLCVLLLIQLVIKKYCMCNIAS